jgi:transposase
MSIGLLAIDLGKHSFHIHGIGSDGVIISRKTSRAKLVGVIEELAPATIAMEACGSAHYWGRRFLAAGCRVLLINPRFVKPFVKGRRGGRRRNLRGSHASDHALHPCQVGRTTGHLQSLHRVRDRVVCARTALINHMRGLLAEYAVILPQGAWRFAGQAPAAIEGTELSDLARDVRRYARRAWQP